jgi:hypothetical protein
MPGISSLQDWREWQQGSRQPVIGENPAVQEIPPMLRRRLSPLGKMALSVAWPLLRETPSIPSVFCSRHGELERTAGMLQELAAGQALSPTHFSLSVHNAIGGVFSIAREDRSAISALAVGDEGFSEAMLETRLIAAEQRVPEALCLIYDASPPTVYSEFGHGPRWPFALAVVLGPSGDGDPGFSLRKSTSIGEPGPLPLDEPQALSFVRFLLDEDRDELWLPCRGDYWHWLRQN